MSFHYVAVKKNIDFVDEESNDFEDWLLNICTDIQSLNFANYCYDSNCIYCDNRLVN